MKNNKNKILEKSAKLYKIVTNNRNSKMNKFYKELSCDFELLEKESLKYKN